MHWSTFPDRSISALKVDGVIAVVYPRCSLQQKREWVAVLTIGRHTMMQEGFAEIADAQRWVETQLPAPQEG